eukprot:767338-Hanusia_phi.AAC.4
MAVLTLRLRTCPRSLHLVLASTSSSLSFAMLRSVGEKGSGQTRRCIIEACRGGGVGKQEGEEGMGGDGGGEAEGGGGDEAMRGEGFVSW